MYNQPTTKYTEQELTTYLLDQLNLPDNHRDTNAEAVQITGWSERSIRRRKAKLRNATNLQPSPTVTTTSNPNPQLTPEGAVQTRGKVSRYTPGVGWDSVEYVPNHADVLTLEQVLEPLTDNPPPLTTTSQPTTKQTLVIALSDLQAGKTDELGGTKQLTQRIRTVFDQIESYLRTTGRPGEIVLADTGDILEGFSNTIAQQQTNDLSLTDQIRYAQRIVTEAIRRFAPYASKFTYIAVPSNHCAVRTGTGSKNRANAPDDDWGLLISENVEQALRMTSDYDHVQVVRPSKWEEAVTHTTVDGTVLAVTHGHQFGSGKAADWFAKMTVGKRSNMHKADVLLFGHHHSLNISLMGAGQFAIGAPTIDNGSAWFSNNSGASSPASMLTFALHDNKASDWVVYYPH